MFDLGVSSLQLDEADRGFAYRVDAPLDMRMDQSAGITAADVLNTYSVDDLTRVLKEYGEERFARKIAARRGPHRVRTSRSPSSARLVELLRRAIPMASQRQSGHPAKRTFQALRIEVNDELAVWGRAVAVRDRRPRRRRPDRGAVLPLARGPGHEAGLRRWRHLEHPRRPARRAPGARGIPLARHPGGAGAVRGRGRREPPRRVSAAARRRAHARHTTVGTTVHQHPVQPHRLQGEQGMSQMTATARPLRAPRRGPVSAPLRVMPARITNTGHGAFAGICVVLLTVGLIGLLLLNTAPGARLARPRAAPARVPPAQRQLGQPPGVHRPGLLERNPRPHRELARDGPGQPARLHRPLDRQGRGRGPARDDEQRAPDRDQRDAAGRDDGEGERRRCRRPPRPRQRRPRRPSAAAGATPKTAGAAAGGSAAATLGSSATSPEATSGTSGTSVSPQTPATR